MKTVLFFCDACGSEKEGSAYRSKAVRGGRRYCSSACSSTHATSRDPLVRFWEKVDKNGPNGCWVWTGATRGFVGYGNFWFERKNVDAHRFVLEHIGGQPIPDGMCALHRCDNPSCVNPDHLFVGTHQENTDDKIAKGRDYREGRKLTEDEQKELFRLLKAGHAQVSVVRQMGINPRTVVRYAKLLKLMGSV